MLFHPKDKLGGGFKYLLFSPLLGKISNLTNIFQMGWNHQLANYLKHSPWWQPWFHSPSTLRPVSQPVLLEPSETKTSHKQRACRCKWRSFGKWEASLWVSGILMNLFDLFPTYTFINKYIHILLFCHDFVHAHTHEEDAHWRGWSLGSHQKVSYLGAVGEKSIRWVFLQYIFFTCILVYHYMSLRYSAIDSKNNSPLNPFWMFWSLNSLCTGFIVLAIFQE